MLYVDEVNLLHDHLVDLLLDAAALGTCYVEREGVSVRHPARFLLVGTMNPEEGELRPQLLDRFGLTVEAVAPQDPDIRAEVIRRRLAYDRDPDAFVASSAGAEASLAQRIVAAQDVLDRVVLTDAALRQVASVCAAFGVDGLRADLVTARAALAHAAWSGRLSVTAEDIRAAARLALPHRRRRQPFDAPGLPDGELDQALADAADDDGPDDDGAGPDDDRGPDGGPGPSDGQPPPGSTTSAKHSGAPDGPTPPAPTTSLKHSGAPDHMNDSVMRSGTGDGAARSGAEGAGEAADAPAAPGEVFRVRRLDVPGTGAGAPGRRSRARGGVGRITGAQRPRGRPAGSTWPPRWPRPRRISSPAAGPRRTRSGCAATTCASRNSKAGRATWSCSWWTRAGRWRPGPGWARSRARCCPC